MSEEALRTDWKAEKTMSHYEYEYKNKMLLLEIKRALVNFGIENEQMDYFIDEKLNSTVKCLNGCKTDLHPEHSENTENLTQVPNSEENAVNEKS